MEPNSGPLPALCQPHSTGAQGLVPLLAAYGASLEPVSTQRLLPLPLSHSVSTALYFFPFLSVALCRSITLLFFLVLCCSLSVALFIAVSVSVSVLQMLGEHAAVSQWLPKECCISKTSILSAYICECDYTYNNAYAYLCVCIHMYIFS